MKCAVKCNDVSIRYITGDFKDIGIKEFIMRKITGKYVVTEFWADKNISFELEKGDMLGIIGSNGAGKSTLLKAISGVMIPTKGYIQTNGNVAALLELTSGFDGDLTVKENTYLRGAMLGYTREFMNDMYEHIIDFAELKGFEERTYKQLSSGMKSRLAFSIACLVNPDILILDEVLAVGDGAFRIKSGNKMREILNGGLTGILVSHSEDLIRELCNKVLWLDKGKQVVFTDKVDTCVDAYEEFLIHKNIPKNDKEIKEMSLIHQERIKRENEKRDNEDLQIIESLLNKNDTDLMKQTLEIIQKNRPDLFDKYM